MKLRYFTILLLASTLITSTFNSCNKFGKNKSGTFTDDRDGKEYGWVKIGEQTWMSENLAYTGDNGHQVNKTLNDSIDVWYNGDYSGWCYYNDDQSNGNKYGVLYQWEAAKHACPEGWHLPTHNEVADLDNVLWQDYLVTNFDKYGNSKTIATDYDWEPSDELYAIGNDDFPDDRNSTGFSALPAGIRTTTSNGFLGDKYLIDHSQGAAAYFWTSTDNPPEGTWRLAIVSDGSELLLSNQNSSDGASCRCIQD